MTEILTILNNITKVEGIELAFSSFLVQRPEDEAQKVTLWQQELSSFFEPLNSEYLDNTLRQYLNVASQSSHSQMVLLLDLLEYCMRKGTLPARRVCEFIITTNQLYYQNSHFWICCFKLLKNVLELVDYKGVRDILKGCYERAKELPQKLTTGTKLQNQAYLDLVKNILDRDACLLPGYLVASELQKPFAHFPHWSVAGLFSDYIESFRPCAQMVSIIGHSHMRPVVKYSGCSDYLLSQWKLDPITLSFGIKRGLPYDPELLEKQTGLLRYVLGQPYSRDMVCHMLGLNKQYKDRCQSIEEQLVELIVMALEKSDVDGPETDRMWSQLSSQLIYFVLFNFAIFPHVVTALHARLQGKDVRRGRDHLMWMLLQFISGSIQRHPLAMFMPVIKLCDLLFPEQDLPLPVPDFSQPQCTRQMAMICIWIHFFTKKPAHFEQTKINWPLPTRLRSHHEFLQHLLPPNSTSFGMGNDYRIALLCNAYSTNNNSECFSIPMAAFLDAIKVTPKPGPGGAAQPSCPISMALLDSLTVHAKMSLIHSIVAHIVKMANSKSGLPLAPALVETYSRLLVYSEIEALGIKGFIVQLLPQVFKSHAWGIMYTLLEMFSYRMHHIQPHYRVQVLSHLHSLAGGPQANQTHLFLCVETTALTLIAGLGSSDVQPELSRFLADQKTIISTESEELNRILVLTLARATVATRSDGGWCVDVLNTIAQHTPHTWSQHTLQCLPTPMQEFYNQQPLKSQEYKQQLKKAVEEENRKWASMTNENDMMAHFGVPGAPPLFLCLIWKMLLDKNHITPIAYKILERIGARALSAHLRRFCDYLVSEFTTSGGGQHVNRCVDTINDMIWKHNILTIDRLVLCLTLRTLEGSEAQVCSFIIQLVLLKATEFRNRVTDFVRENTKDHWNQTNWHEKHMEFLRKYPEKFAMEEQPSGYQPYFGNVCLRFIPVFDVVVHRFIEITQVYKSLEILLEHLGCLYKFHNRPVGFLYDTLHFYEGQLRDQYILKRKLSIAILINHREDLSQDFQCYMGTSENPEEAWSGVPDLEYFMRMVKRMVNVVNGSTSNFQRDWRFTEFPNAVNYILYITCVELMLLPVGPDHITKGLLDVTLKGHMIIPLDSIHEWINVIGIILSALPKAYWDSLFDLLLATMMDLNPWPQDYHLFRMFNFKETHLGFLNTDYSSMIAMAHSAFHHACPGQIASISDWMSQQLPQVVRTEEQFLFVCHLIGPFLQRLNLVLQSLTTTLYELLVQVDSHQPQLKYLDTICDFFYHIKYMFGDFANSEVEGLIRKLSGTLQMRFRFMTSRLEDAPQAS
ncbi:mediator of RNA polymerase II transcription subunit 23 [Euwallacea similis]|uniref:mediator of RNA polymerase II transcription subunit 23 n=1 Tax=Euwallacea similis TaxID=1736056 RepID=UPI00344E2BD3